MATYLLLRQPAAGGKKFGAFFEGSNGHILTFETARRRRKKIWGFFDSSNGHFRDSPPQAEKNLGLFLMVQMATYLLPRQPAAGGKKFGAFFEGSNGHILTSETARRRRKKIWGFF